MKLSLLTLALLFITCNLCFSQDNKVYSLSHYLEEGNNLKLDYLVKVESYNNILTLYGYEEGDNSTLLLRKVRLSRYEVLAVSDWSFFGSKGHWSPSPISLTTVPFKVRPKTDGFMTNASSGLNNVGFNFDLLRRQTERYFANGNKSVHKIYAGLWVAPTVEELDAINTKGYLGQDVKSKQLFFSTALTFNYTYNNLTFTFVPRGYEFATSSVGNNWVYNRKKWWGFGIGIEPKILNTLINK